MSSKKYPMADILTAIFVMILISVSSSYLAYKHAIKSMNQSNFAVMDYSQILSSIPIDHDPVKLEAVLINLGEKIGEIAEQGYIVIDKKNVIVAPEHMEIKLDSYVDAIKKTKRKAEEGQDK